MFTTRLLTFSKELLVSATKKSTPSHKFSVHPYKARFSEASFYIYNIEVESTRCDVIFISKPLYNVLTCEMIPLQFSDEERGNFMNSDYQGPAFAHY
ncbi:hypothetical protein T4D_3239 [Trichinella pseudospiralis]|uniref:Uncharacterized protein n=1 Tax=Trichinella pseudospiralis TaxID=6337 RepID=A0A0V1FR91_TRIPS|nr:hypothetical protein T4D_3239 [Trichinella pseudospiralis]